MLVTALFLFITTLVLCWVYLRAKTRHMAKLAAKIPGPKPSPLWKKIFNRSTDHMSGDMFFKMVQLSQMYKSTFCLWKGYELFVFVQDIRHIAALLADSEEVARSCTYKYSKPWLGSSMLLAEGKSAYMFGIVNLGACPCAGEKWKSRRKLIAPEFRPSNLESSVKILSSNTDNLLDRLATFVDGPEFDVHYFMNLHSLDNVWETLTGAKVDALQNSESKFVKAINNASHMVHSRSMHPLLHLDLLFNMSSLGRMQAKDVITVRAGSATAVEDRRRQLLQEGVRNRVPILDTLIELSKKGTAHDDVDPTTEINAILIAGYETTAAALGFACWLLSRHQDIQEKVLKEQREIFGDSHRFPTYRDIQQMKYLEMVIKETLRLYPSVPLFGRKLRKDFDVGDFTIPAGANVMFLAYQIHRNPELFPDPENFDPDRFLPDTTLRRNPYSYLAFAAGPRNCMGMKFGLMVTKGTMSALIRRFKILPGNTPLSLDYTIALKSRTGMKLRLESRSRHEVANDKTEFLP
ncbi:hypothetical protein Cfor_03141 [Coptotermes formosanus]|uniref:Cytochrome P450 n=1 Tax=Coptotermes formosanus TaxID=36987 RepID=A0A6L2PUB8_COPFO|nr:hypothetical protein Cfor_03141 [Coptotermes formosanus]